MRTHEGLIVGRIAQQFQCEVGLHRSADLDRAAWIDRPSAFGKLVVEDVAHACLADRVALTTQECQQKNIFRLEDGIAFELAGPVAVVILPG